MEGALRQLKGVESSISGYAGDHVADPSYHSLCSGSTGHAEVPKVATRRQAFLGRIK
jgi:peptide methionine sulfoxide reductase MsrA